MSTLTEKVAVITGGASGIGRALGEACARHGMKVVLADVDEAGVQAAALELRRDGFEATGFVVDVSDSRAVQALADRTHATYGAAYLVCLNAGVAAGGITWELDERAWRWVLDVNLWGVVNGVRAFVPGLVAQRQGHILLTASTGGLQGSPGMAPYSASKHAVIGIAESLREDLLLAKSPVGVTVLCPGFTATRMNDSGRSWPERLGSPPESGLQPGHPRLREAFLARMNDAADADEVAASALAAVLAKSFWAVTDPAIGARLSDHLSPVLSDSAAFPSGKEWKAPP